jgi:site-specific recombinase XerD
MRRLRKSTGIEHLQAHTFRRTFAITALRNGMSVHHLARFMGHEDIHVLRRYLGLVESDLQSAHQAAGPVDRMLKR